MKKKELIDKLLEITNDGFTSVKLLPETIKKHSEEAYSCILETLEEKAKKSYIESQNIADFKDNNLLVRIEFMSSPKKAGIKDISLMKNDEKILILQGIMNVYIGTLIDKIGQELPEIILKRLQEQKSE
ncbi:MAG: hypothetical protein ACOCV3_07065 [Halanaerobiales bacterium]